MACTAQSFPPVTSSNSPLTSMGTEAERNEKEVGWCPLGQRQPRELGTHHSRADTAWRASSSPAACVWSLLQEDISEEGVLTTPPQPPKTRGGLLPPQLPTPSLCLSPAWSGELTAARIQIWVHGRPWLTATRRQISPLLPWPAPSTQSLESASTQ